MTGAGEAVQYLELTVLPDSIPIWGHCHKRLGNNVLLYDTSVHMPCNFIAVVVIVVVIVGVVTVVVVIIVVECISIRYK